MRGSSSTSSFALARLPLSRMKILALLQSLLTWDNIVSWRTLAIIFALTNIKALPFSWHLRLFHLMFAYGRNKPKIQRFILRSPRRKSDASASDRSKRLHPLFRPVTISMTVPLLEMDYNLHKSNSTYFADLDHSRTALVTSILAPALGLNSLHDQGIKGTLSPLLGSVHTSFLKEIKPFESYSVRSRLLGWDHKWIVIASYFVRAPTAREKAKAKKEGRPVGEEVLLACALNKYVIKSRRRTIPPELALASSGWFQVRKDSPMQKLRDNRKGQAGEGPQPMSSPPNGVGNGSVSVSVDATESNSPVPTPQPSDASLKATETAQRVAGELNRRLSIGADSQALTLQEQSQSRGLESTATGSGSGSGSGSDSGSNDNIEIGGWTWDEIEAERVRGMQIADHWMALDADLKAEYAHELEY